MYFPRKEQRNPSSCKNKTVYRLLGESYLTLNRNEDKLFNFIINCMKMPFFKIEKSKHTNYIKKSVKYFTTLSSKSTHFSLFQSIKLTCIQFVSHHFIAKLKLRFSGTVVQFFLLSLKTHFHSPYHFLVKGKPSTKLNFDAMQ